jgi:cell division protein FtsZ
MTEVGIMGAETVACNTDAQDLLYTNSDRKVLLGKELTGGLGAGSIPKIGEESARESEHDIKDALQGADMVFVTCGLGGGTGTGSAPVIAEIAKKLGALTVAVVTMPFSMEGNRRYENALIGLEKLENTVDTLIVIPNDKLLELAPDLPIQTAFKVADEILTNAVKGIAELVTKAGLVNLDFADIRAVMGKGGVALIGVGESDSDNRAVEAVERAVNNPLLDVDISGANGALINVIGGPDLTLDEAKKVIETVSQKLDEDARMIWGAQIYDDMNKTLRVMLIVTGVKSAQIFGRGKKPQEIKKEMKSDLGIEFVD